MVEGGGGGGYGRRDWVKVVVVVVFGMCVVVEDGSGCLTRAMVVVVAVGWVELWWKSVGSDSESDWLVVKVVVIVGDGGGCVIVVGISDLTVLWLLGAVEGWGGGGGGDATVVKVYREMVVFECV